MPDAPVRAVPRDDEDFRDTLFVADRHTWSAFAAVARRRGMSRSALLRRYIRWEVARARRAGEIA